MVAQSDYQSVSMPQIASLVLWPKNSCLGQRVVRFSDRKVNYLWSPSRTGKSYLWPILDFVLGSKNPRFSSKLLLKSVEWFELEMRDPDVDKDLRLMARCSSAQSKAMLNYRNPDLPRIRPRSNISTTEYLASIRKPKKELSNTPFGQISNRDLILLNHIPQHGLGDPDSFMCFSGKSYSRLKITYFLKALLEPNESENALYSRYMERNRVKQKGPRTILESLNDEFSHLVRLASEIGILEDPIEYLKQQPFEVGLRELGFAANQLSFKKITENGLDTRYVRGSKLSPYELGVLAGRISEFLRIAKSIHDQIRKQDADLNEELGQYEQMLVDSSVEGFEKMVTDEISRCIDLMGLDRIPGNLRINVETMGLCIIDSKGQNATLRDIGGQQNIVGYNIATMLALHISLRRIGFNILFPFLVIDQPSQAFHEAKVSLSAQEAQNRLQLIFRALDDLTGTVPEMPMVIVLERAPPEGFSSFKNSVVIEEWGDETHGLLPTSWIDRI